MFICLVLKFTGCNSNFFHTSFIFTFRWIGYFKSTSSVLLFYLFFFTQKHSTLQRASTAWTSANSKSPSEKALQHVSICITFSCSLPFQCVECFSVATFYSITWWPPTIGHGYDYRKSGGFVFLSSSVSKFTIAFDVVCIITRRNAYLSQWEDTCGLASSRLSEQK